MGLAKGAIVYSAVNILQRSIGLALLPVYTHYLSPEDYGVISVVGTIVPVLSIFFALSLRSSVTRLYFRYRDKNPERVPLIWGSALLLVLLNTLLLASGILLIGWLTEPDIFKGISFFPFISLGVLSAAFLSTFELYQASLQARQRSVQYGVQKFSLFLLQLVLTITLVVVFNWGALGALVATSAGSLVFFIVALIRFIPEVRFNLKIDIVKEILSYSLPLLPHALAGWAAGMTNRIFLNNMLDTAAVGLFSVGFQFGNIINILSSSVNQAFQPWFFECMESEKDRRNEIIRAANALILGYTYAALTLSLLSPTIIQILTESSYHESWIVVPAISFAYVFSALYYIASSVIFLEKVKFVSFITITSSLISILANWLFIDLFGMIGASYATVITFLVSSTLAAIIGSRILHIGFQWWRLFGTIVCGMLLTYSILILNILWINLVTIIITGLLVTYLERNAISQLLQRFNLLTSK